MSVSWDAGCDGGVPLCAYWPEPILSATAGIEGLLAGIGFIGGGTILKLTDRVEVRGLTTASTIWLAAGVGSAVGVGLIVLAIFATFLSLVILVLGWRVENWMGNRSDEVGKPG
jgi:putative Mg2+ transporter-C (MgtC) family protein